MEKHAPAVCPQCGISFACKVNAVLKCACMDIVLTPNEAQFIRENSESGECLCPACLRQLKDAYHRQKSIRTNN